MALRWRHEGWRKLYVREEGSFAQLPLYVRALHAELLKICDSGGRIDCMGKEPWAAVAWRMGADRSDRRMLKKHIPLLLEDGCLTRDEATGDLFIKNFLNAHPHLVNAEGESMNTTPGSVNTAMEGVDRIAVDDGQPGASVFDLAAARMAKGGVTPLHHGQGELATAIPVVDDRQLSLFGPAAEVPMGWATPPPIAVPATPATSGPVATDPRPIHDSATTVPRRSTQPTEIAVVRSEEKRREDQKERGEAHPPRFDQFLQRAQTPIPIPSGASDREVARTLAAEQEHLRRSIDPDAHPTPLDDTTARVQRLLRGGWAPEVLRAALEAAAAEARQKGTLRWFNGVDNWKEEAMRRTLANRALARRAPPRSSAPTSVPAQPRDLADPGDFAAARRALGMAG